MNAHNYPLTIYYDASCPLCNGEMRNLMLRNVDGLLQFVDASAADFRSPLAGITREDLMDLLHARKAKRQVAVALSQVKVTPDAQVVNADGEVIPGLYAAGETVGLFYRTYTGSTSVLRGAVFGRIAGRHAARMMNQLG